MTTTTDMVEVTQADSQAAKAAWNAIADEFNQWDTLSLEEAVSWVLAFARHRLATQPQGGSSIGTLREALTKIIAKDQIPLNSLYRSTDDKPVRGTCDGLFAKIARGALTASTGTEGEG